MKRIQSLPNSIEESLNDTRGHRGFTVLELLVAVSLSTILFGIITESLMFQSDTYLGDIARTRIQQNLRSALDVVSMNVRQAGEGLDEYFPAVTLSQSGSPANSTLALRRKILNEVLTVCLPATIGNPTVFVTDMASTTSECLPVNVSDSITSWTTNRTTTGGVVPVYIYDRVAKVGEFINYSGEGSSGGNNYLIVQPPTHNYPAHSSNIFVLEEFNFRLDRTTNTLELYKNGDMTSAQDVAYKVNNFTAGLTLRDGTALNSLASTDAHRWKELQKVTINLTGQEKWKSKNFTRTVVGEYFPRNVLSH